MLQRPSIIALFVAFILGFVTQTQAQLLVKTQTFYGSKAMNKARRDLGVSLVNKPNGVIYRLRIEQNYPDLHRPQQMEGWEAPISVATEDGYMMLLHKEEGFYAHKYWCLLYDKEQKLIHAFDLCAIGDQSDCEITDIRYNQKQLIWNFSCITYASSLNNKCNRLFCFDVEKEQLLWKSQYLTSRDIFTFDDDYIYSGYGFTDEPDFVYLIDRKNGLTLTQCAVESAPQYMELTREGLFVQDYRDNGYLFRVIDGAAIKVTGDNVRLREGPSTHATIYSYNRQKPTYPVNGDVFEQLGESGDFNKVKVNGKSLYISKQFSAPYVLPHFDTSNQPKAGVKAWIGRDENNEVYFEVYDMDKFTEAVELLPEESNDLECNQVYNVSIGSPLACGVFLSPCREYGSVLFILSEDGRLFGLDMLEATADDGTPLQAIEFPMGKFAVRSLEATQKNGVTTVWAVNSEGNKKKVDSSRLQQYK